MTRAAQRSEPQADSTALRDAFLKWQCLTRQIAVRQNQGRPDEAVTPAVLLKGKTEAYDHIITVLSKTPQQSLLPELQHLVRRTLDPAQRRQKALELLSETYYQKPTSFSDILTATFPPQSPRAAVIRKADHCRLLFSGYGQSYQIECKIWALTKKNTLYQATFWHNLLFNPGLHPDTIVLGFEPDWTKSTSEPLV
ncbi:MAG: hypothetical protein OSA82_12760 [Paracoccaceae bacterium]|nr:hypothetical protein [Paracoccaceae bacterium]